MSTRASNTDSDAGGNGDVPSETRSVIISGGMLGGGGVQTHLSLLCLVLRRAGLDVTLLASSSQWPEDVVSTVRASGTRLVMPPALFRSGQRSKLATLFNIRRLPRGNHTVCCIGEGRVHAHVVRRFAPQSFCVYHEIVDAPNLARNGTRCPAPVDAFIANSKAVAEGMRRFESGVPSRVIPFITGAAPTPRPPERPPVGERTLRVTYLGRLAPHKRPDVLVREWRNLCAAAPIGPAELHVYGYGDMEQDVARIVRDGALGDVVHLHGRYSGSELPHILANSDVVVLPSFFEGLPLVLVEAMLGGVPIVACESGGVREFSEDNPDAITTGLEWDEFVAGLREMAGRLRAGRISATRLHDWTEARYGFDRVSRMWVDAMTRPRAFFLGKSPGRETPRRDDAAEHSPATLTRG